MSCEHPVRPYAFERVFSLSAANAAMNPRDQTLKIMDLQAELARLRAETDAELVRARADGFACGLAQARADVAAALLTAETTLADGLDRLEACFAETEGRMARLASEVAFAAADLLSARATADDPALAVDAAVARVLAQTGFREKLHVHVNGALVPALRDLVAAREAVEQRQLAITIHDDASLVPGDAHILWDQGGLSLDIAARRRAVAEALGLGDI